MLAREPGRISLYVACVLSAYWSNRMLETAPQRLCQQKQVLNGSLRTFSLLVQRYVGNKALKTVSAEASVKRQAAPASFIAWKSRPHAHTVFPFPKDPSKSLYQKETYTVPIPLQKGCQSSGAVWKSRWPSWAPVPNKPTVYVDVKQHWTRTHELCESRGGRPGLPSLISLRFLWT